MIIRLCLGMMILLLVGCVDERSESEIKHQIDAIQHQKPPSMVQSFQFPTFKTVTYEASPLRSPFAPYHLSNETPLHGRKRDYLEQFPLDTFTMTGTIQKGNAWYALIKDKAGTVHRVGRGQHLGQYLGIVVEVMADKTMVVEKTLNAEGEWVSRQVSLHLLEN